MECCWQELLQILPARLRQDVDRYGRASMTELRIRISRPVEIVTTTGIHWLQYLSSKEDIQYCINAATRYSPWISESIFDGYVTASGGHRIGVCGEWVYNGQAVKNVNHITSLCIRVARDMVGCSRKVPINNNSILIIGSPGTGKSTLLRDMIRRMSDTYNTAVTVVDERRELFPISNGIFAFNPGKRTDVMYGCKKADGIEIALRTMSPQLIAVDEITALEDCNALEKAAWCGVRLLATAHAGNIQEFMERTIYRPIIEKKIFRRIISMNSDKSWREDVL